MNLSYKVAPDMLFYGLYSRGNSPGGFNSGAAASINFRPQQVDSFELGLKLQFLDRRLRLNAAVFDNYYKDLQFFQVAPINGVSTQITLNAAKAHGRGLDVDATAILSNSLRFNVQYTYQMSKITGYVIPSLPAPQLSFNGIALVRSPKHSLNTSLAFARDIGPGRFQLTVEESYSSAYNNDYSGAAAGTAYPARPGIPAGVTTSQVLYLLRTPGYATTNLNASFGFDGWEVSGVLRNLFNKQYIILGTVPDAFTYPGEVPGEPRTFQVFLKRSF